MTSSASDLSPGGLRTENETRYLFCIDLMDSLMRLLSKIPSTTLKKFILVNAGAQARLSHVGTYMSDVMSIFSERARFLSSVT